MSNYIILDEYDPTFMVTCRVKRNKEKEKFEVLFLKISYDECKNIFLN